MIRTLPCSWGRHHDCAGTVIQDRPTTALHRLALLLGAPARFPVACVCSCHRTARDQHPSLKPTA